MCEGSVGVGSNGSGGGGTGGGDGGGGGRSNNSSSSTNNNNNTGNNNNANCCLSIVTVVVAISMYILLGATAFFFLENDPTAKELSLPKLLIKSYGNELESLRNSTVQRLWILTLELNVFYESNWTNLAELELQKFQDELLKFMFNSEQQLLLQQQQNQQNQLHNNNNNNHYYYLNTAGNGNGNGNGNGGGSSLSGNGYRNRELYDENSLHNFPAALLYCLTLITTIGYGSVSPKSMSGRILTVLYATVGIPLTLCYLATVGDYFARCIRSIYIRIVKRDRRNVRNNNGRSYGVPIPISLILLILYLAGGAGVFWWLEGWSFIDALFFCFASLATIGFGGMLDPHSKHISLLISSLYILLGMALISTVFNLIQDEILRRRGEKRDGRYHRPIS